MRVRLPSAIGLAALIAPAVTGCASTDSPGSDSTAVQVVTSTNVYGTIATAIGGSRVEVTSFIDSPAQDPHSYLASNRDLLAVSEADLVVENGGGYDDFMDQLLDGADTNATVLNAVDISGLTAADGDELNEHVWYDLPSVQRIASAIADSLAEADPAGAAAYRRHAAAFDAEVQALVDREAAMRPELRGTTVGITEPVPLSMLESLGAVDVTPEAFSEAVEEGEDVPVSVLEDTLELYSDHEVDALVYNEQTTGATTEQVQDAANAAGIPVVGVTELLPAGDTYASWMAANLDALDRALSPR